LDGWTKTLGNIFSNLFCPVVIIAIIHFSPFSPIGFFLWGVWGIEKTNSFLFEK